MKTRNSVVLGVLLVLVAIGFLVVPQPSDAHRPPIRPSEPEWVQPQWDPEVPDGGEPARQLQGSGPGIETDGATGPVRSAWVTRILRALHTLRLVGVVR
jgi:hypothetical protein